jgi:hypothetical protein
VYTRWYNRTVFAPTSQGSQAKRVFLKKTISNQPAAAIHLTTNIIDQLLRPVRIAPTVCGDNPNTFLQFEPSEITQKIDEFILICRE